MSILDGKDAATRKAAPVYSGFMAYFPDAMIAVAELSRIGNDQHNPGQSLHWSKDKSNDHADCLARHMLDIGRVDTDLVLHETKVAWRAMAQLQVALEARAKAALVPAEAAMQEQGASERRMRSCRRVDFTSDAYIRGSRRQSGVHDRREFKGPL